MKKICLLLMAVGLLFIFARVWAGNDLAADLKSAQEALAAKEYEKAFTEYSYIAQKKNNPLAQFTLAMFYQLGWGRPIDPIEACKWHKKAAQGDIPAAAHFYAECLEKGIAGSANPAMAAAWYDKAAALGHHISLCSLSELYMKGSGVIKDPAKGIALCRKAAELNIVSAQIRLGRFLLEGEDSIRDFKEAYHWLKLAAQKNIPEAQYYLGVMFRDGLGVPKEHETARGCFELAANQGYVPAYFYTGQLYFSAPVDPQTEKLSEHDLAKAYMWLSATTKQSKNPSELENATKILKKILDVMPKTWIPSLDAKVAKHLAEHQVP